MRLLSFPTPDDLTSIVLTRQFRWASAEPTLYRHACSNNEMCLFILCDVLYFTGNKITTTTTFLFLHVEVKIAI